MDWAAEQPEHISASINKCMNLTPIGWSTIDPKSGFGNSESNGYSLCNVQAVPT